MIEALLNSLWHGAFVVGIAAGVTALVPQRHAATRYAVWFVSLVALALLPLSGEFWLGEPVSAIPSSVIRTTSVATHATQQAASANALWFAIVWGLGVALCSARLAFSHFRIARIVSGATLVPHLGERVLASSAIAIPVAAGLFRPVVIVPSDLVQTLDPVDLEAIVAHERAHIARNDVLGNLAQRVLESLLFFNPWVYVIGRQLVKEREAACDDRAVRTGRDAERYASCLAGIALRSPRAPSPLLTPSAIGSGRMLVGRIARLLDGKVAQVKTNYAVVAAAIVLFAILGFALQTPNGLASTNCSSEVEILNAAAPKISEAVAKAHPNSQVKLLVTVTENGIPFDVKMVQSSGVLAIDEAVVDAATHSTYKPEVRNCQAVSGGQYLFRAVIGP